MTDVTPRTPKEIVGNWQVNGFLIESNADNITANPGGGQAGAVQLFNELNRITTVATSGDSVKLPPSQNGLTIIVENRGANPMQVYGSGADTVNDVAAATGVSQMAGSVVIYTCYTAGAWYANGLGTGYAGSFETASYTTGITAHAGGGQGSAVPLTSMTNFVSTVVTAGDSLLLPAALPGMVVTVINQSATATGPNVFPQSGQTINALAANTAIAVAPQSVLIFYCGIAGSWWTK